MTPLLSAAILRTQSDRRLVQLARAGHDAAFTVIVERYRAPLRGYCLRILPDGRVDDALQQAFLQAWRALQDGREVRELRPWLYATVHNAAVSQLRRGVFDYVELMDTVQGAEEPEADLERKALMRQTLAAVAALPERQREALLAVALEGLPQAQVAGQMGLSENGLRQLLFRARTTLRSAATALTPLPVLSWALRPAAAGGLHERVAEAAAGAGAAAGGASAVHAGTALLVASTIAVTGTVSLQNHRAVHRSAGASATALGPHDATAVPTAFVVHRVASSGRTRLSAVARHRRAATSTRRRVVRVAALRGRHGLRVAPAGVAVHAAPAAIAPVSVLDPEPTALAAVAAPEPAQTAEPLAPPPATTDDDDGHGDPASSDGRDSGDGHEDGDGRTDGDGGGDHADGDQRTVSADSSGEGGGGDRSAAAQAPHEA